MLHYVFYCVLYDVTERPRQYYFWLIDTSSVQLAPTNALYLLTSSYIVYPTCNGSHMGRGSVGPLQGRKGSP